MLGIKFSPRETKEKFPDQAKDNEIKQSEDLASRGDKHLLIRRREDLQLMLKFGASNFIQSNKESTQNNLEHKQIDSNVKYPPKLLR